MNPNEPAFPQPFIYEPDKGASGVYTSAFDVGFGGLTIRDYFAAKALQGMLASNDEDKMVAWTNAEKAAAWSYLFADAILAAREKGAK